MEIDYNKIGLVAGLECHQQLNTKKLFCECESELSEDKPDFIVKRRLRPVASESGAFDKAAMQEFKKGKEFIYEGYYNKTCLVELDEEPPHAINKDSLNAVLEVAKKINASVFDKAFVMRKMVIDGSNTSGFQRTILIARGGELDIGTKKVGIGDICLEEDSAKNIESTDKYTKYRLDRLGIPLIEFTTKPDLNSPNEVKECAKRIGELFRITGYAKRGLGSIRQDLNVSVNRGTRIEVKGVQYLDLIDKYVEYEATRQLVLIELMDKLNKQNTKDKQKLEIIDITNIIDKADNEKVKKSIKEGHKALAIKVLGFDKVFGIEVQPGRRVGSELSSYAKAKTKVKGLFHSDELPKYGIDQSIVNEIRAKLKMDKNDGFVIIIEREDTAKEALKVVFDRIIALYEGIPKETRNPLEDGTTEYARPLPGAARMYPETDIMPLSLTKDMISSIKVPKWYSDRIKDYIKLGLNNQFAEQIAMSNYAKDFERLSKLYDLKALADFILAIPERFDIDKNLWILDLEKENKIDRKDFRKVIDQIIKGNTKSEIISSFQKTQLDKESTDIIIKILENSKDFIKSRGEASLNPLVGSCIKEISAKLNKKPDMKALSDFIKSNLSKYM